MTARSFLAVFFLLACSRKTPAPPPLVIPAVGGSCSAALAHPEGYSLRFDSDGKPTVEASTPAGRFYAEQTLRQLDASSQTVCDAPRFRWRGLHLDVARHFFSVKDVEHLLELMARLKLNVFHWHLTDDQGWRLPIRGHPELTAQGPAYTRAEIAHVVDYARQRFITVVPELDLPGHTRALLASHPELSCRGKPLELPTAPGIYEDVLCIGNPDTYALLDEILADVAAQFPGPYLHLGGDEVPTTRWDECPKCRGQKGQAVFLARVAATARRLGKRVVGWDEVLDHEPPSDLVVMAWRDLEAGRRAIAAGHDTVLVPYQVTYLDRSQNPYDDGAVTLEKIGAFEPFDSPHVLGIEAALWTEYVPDIRRAEVQLFPRLLAVADAAWSSADARAKSPLATRLPHGLELLSAMGVTWFLAPPLGLRPRAAFLDAGVVELKGSGGVIHYTLDGTDPTVDSPRYDQPLIVTRTSRIAARSFLGDRASPIARGAVVIEPPLPAVDAGTDGVRFAYFEGSFERLPDLDLLTPVRTGTSATLIPEGVRENDWALRLDGVFVAASTGVQRFRLVSDDGARLWVDERLVIDNDGLHAPRPREGEIALAAGAHRVRVELFQRGGGYALELFAGDAPLTLRR